MSGKKLKTPVMTFSGMVTLLVLVTLFLNTSSCKEKMESIQKQPQAMEQDTIYYQKHIYSLMLVNCTPCHFPVNGHEKMLNTYDSVKNNIDEILRRVQLEVNDSNFMPYLQKKPPLTKEEIQLFIDWKDLDFPQ